MNHSTAMVIAAFLGALLFGAVSNYVGRSGQDHPIIEWVLK